MENFRGDLDREWGLLSGRMGLLMKVNGKMDMLKVMVNLFMQ